MPMTKNDTSGVIARTKLNSLLVHLLFDGHSISNTNFDLLFGSALLTGTVSTPLEPLEAHIYVLQGCLNLCKSLF